MWRATGLQCRRTPGVLARLADRGEGMDALTLLTQIGAIPAFVLPDVSEFIFWKRLKDMV